MCTLSKTMSNGFAMAAVIGRADIMAPAAESFIRYEDLFRLEMRRISANFREFWPI